VPSNDLGTGDDLKQVMSYQCGQSTEVTRAGLVMVPLDDEPGDSGPLAGSDEGPEDGSGQAVAVQDLGTVEHVASLEDPLDPAVLHLGEGQAQDAGGDLMVGPTEVQISDNREFHGILLERRLVGRLDLLEEVLVAGDGVADLVDGADTQGGASVVSDGAASPLGQAVSDG
jgi:hypothetical protein